MAIKKKSQISMQVSWLFILIAGAIILIFFISIVYKQRALSEKQQAGGIAVEIDTLLTGAEVSAGTVNVVDIPEITIDLKCEGDSEPWFGIDWEKTGVRQDLSRKIVFGPSSFKGPKLIAWALSFDAPFKITNFLYITSPDVKYVFVYGSGNNFASELSDNFPDAADKEDVTNLNNVQVNDGDKVRIVFFENVLSSLPASFSGIDVSAVKINNDNTVEFYKTDEDNTEFLPAGSSVYLSNAMIYGAVFAEDADSYDCAARKAFKRMGVVANVIEKKEIDLHQAFTEEPDARGCKDYYVQSFDADTSITGFANSCSQSIDACKTIIGSINTKITELQSRNYILKTIPCPLLY